MNSLNKYALRVYYKPGIVLGTECRAGMKTVTALALMEFII